MSWTDKRMAWKPTDYENITEITLPVDNLWVKNMCYHQYLIRFKN